jgi:phage terminase large subunit-like protein
VAELVALLPDSEREKALAELATTETEEAALTYDWTFWARPKQLPPPGDWRVWLLRSGRGFGKSRAGAEWVRHRAEHGPYVPIALVGQTKADVRDTMVELGESSILKISPPWFRPHFEASKRRLTWPNGMTATFFSGDEPDQLRGPQHGTAWIDEIAKFRYPQESWNNLMLGLRIGADPRVLVTSTPRPIPIIRQLITDPHTVDVTGNTYENANNLSPVFLSEVRRQYEGTRIGRQELYGEILEDVEGALWKRDMIRYVRLDGKA